MNSDPHESAAWRAFGMLDADEAAAFDSAMRQDPELKNAYREMESLTAAVAAVTTVPISPRAGQLESLHLRLGIGATRRTNWLGISGWAAAVVLTAFLVLNNRPGGKNIVSSNPATDPVLTTQQPFPEIHPQTGELIVENSSGLELITDETLDGENLPAPAPVEPSAAIVRVETKRHIQEIEILREQIGDFQERDRKRFEVVPDMAWPLVMRMTPPRSGIALVRENEPTPLTAMLGDALTAADGSGQSLASTDGEPYAIPIYDAARDIGTLYVKDLPATEDEDYVLWRQDDSGEQPILVGKLPKSNKKKSESFDFNLGKAATVPTAFILTKDRKGQTRPPSAANIVLQGPSRK